MTNKVDLHTHSTFSDGSFSPIGLAEAAAASGLSAIALTDHDTVSGLRYLQSLGEKPAVDIVPGVEFITSEDGCPVHIVGLFLDIDASGFVSFISPLEKWRTDHLKSILNNLESHGIDTSELISDSAPPLSRFSIASMLIKNGHASDLSDARVRYLASDASPLYGPRPKSEPQKCIDAIHSAGGVAVIAHLNQISKSVPKCFEVAKKLISSGCDSIEGYYPQYTPEFTKTVLGFAEENGITVSGGSDFHGDFRPGLSLGTGYGDLSVSYSVLSGLQELRSKIYG